MLTPQNLTCEYFTDPLGLDVRQPRLSWKAAATKRGARQTAYQILVGKSPAVLKDPTAGVLWDTGKVISNKMLY